MTPATVLVLGYFGLQLASIALLVVNIVQHGRILKRLRALQPPKPAAG